VNTRIRLVLAMALFAVIGVGGIGAAAWVGKLNLGSLAPAAVNPQVGSVAASAGQAGQAAVGGLEAGLSVAGRPQGTVVTTGPVVPLTGGTIVTVGSCATVLIISPPTGVEYSASVVVAGDLAKELPGQLLGCGIKVDAKPGATLGAQAQVCFPIPPSQAGFAYYWDGVHWVKTTLEPKDAQSCVNIPETAANPAYAGLFDK